MKKKVECYKNNFFFIIVSLFCLIFYTCDEQTISIDPENYDNANYIQDTFDIDSSSSSICFNFVIHTGDMYKWHVAQAQQPPQAASISNPASRIISIIVDPCSAFN